MGLKIFSIIHIDLNNMLVWACIKERIRKTD